MDIFAIDWDSLISAARFVARLLEMPARVLRTWADQVESELEAEFVRETEAE